MQPTLVFLFCLVGTVLSRYHDKTRFDRSIPSGLTEETLKQWSFTDDETYFLAYKDKHENNCYLENLKNHRVKNDDSRIRGKRETNVLYAPTQSLTKIEAWRIAGGRIVEFCKGRDLILLQDTQPLPEALNDPFDNQIPLDENDVLTKRVADVVLAPLRTRAKREIMLEEREKLNKEVTLNRQRRQAPQFRGRYRGQTQAQYLNSDGGTENDGKAEAEAAQQSSRAVVSGSRGMGQAQSMSMGGTGCEDCPGSTGYLQNEGSDRLRTDTLREDGRYTYIPGMPGIMRPSNGRYYPQIPGTRPGVQTPQQIPGTPGTIPSQSDMMPSSLTHPGTSGTTQGTGQSYPGSQTGSNYPSRSYPRQPERLPVYPPGHSGTITPGSYPGTSQGTRGSEISSQGQDTSGIIPQGPGIYQQGTGQQGTSGSIIPQAPGMYPQSTGQQGTSGSMIPQGPGIYQQGTGQGTSGSVIPGMYPQGVITPEGKVIYPGGVMTTQHRTYEVPTPGTQVNYPGHTTATGGQYPGGVVPGTGPVYPGGIQPNIYYGNVQPGMTRPESQGTRVDDKSSYPGMYPDRQGTVMPGRDNIGYPGMYQPGTGVPGTMGPGQQGHQMTGVQSGVPGTYPGGPGAVGPSGSVPGTYPGGPGAVGPSGSVPGTYPGGPGAVGPSGSVPGTYPSVPGAVGPSGTVQGTYPGVPGVVGPSGTVPGVYQPGTTGGTQGIGTGSSLPGVVGPSGTIPGVYQPGTTGTQATGTGSSVPGVVGPSGTIPGVYQPGAPGMYQERIQTPGILHGYYPSGTVPGTVGTGSTIPSGSTKLTGDYPGGPQGTYPGNVYIGTGSNVPSSSGSTSYPGMMPVGQTYPTGTQTGVTGSDQGKGLYQGGIDRGQQQMYPAGQVPQYDGTQIQGGSYPGTPGTKPSYQTGAPGSLYQTEGNVRNEGDGRFQQYPTGVSGQNVGQYPRQYPGMTEQGRNGEVSQYYQQGEQIAPGTEGDDANADSQASSSVKQVDAGTQASASSQGKYGKGTAQSQVMGTYSGSGSFMAQAGTSDVNKSAQTEISGGKEGATSSAQGVGGYGKSQVQVQMDSESGATSTGAQSGGWNHGTNSQVQASSKGGMADAQANGDGSTSSQAQIGFRPYLKTDETEERRAKPFRGGGSASAQSGTYRGQSQSQLEGAFQYGITYTGAAQAGSGSGAAASRKPFNFNLTDPEIFKPFKPYDPPVITKETDETATEKPAGDFERSQDDLQTSSSSQKTAASNQNKNVNHNPQVGNKPRVDDSVYDTNGDYEEEYDDEYYDPHGTQSIPNTKISSVREHNPEQQQSQMIHINSDKRYGVRVKQDSNEPREGDILQPGQSLSGYPVPQGFRGRVTSISGKETLAHGDGKSQSQTVSLVPPGSNGPRETKSPITETRSLKTTHEKLENRARQEKNSGTSARNQVSQDKSDDVQTSPRYYTVTNSVAGKLDGRSAPRKYEHRYYTKSSTCGYFTFSCNIVYGSNGRTKICKPKVPTYPDGTPVKC